MWCVCVCANQGIRVRSSTSRPRTRSPRPLVLRRGGVRERERGPPTRGVRNLEVIVIICAHTTAHKKTHDDRRMPNTRRRTTTAPKGPNPIPIIHRQHKHTHIYDTEFRRERAYLARGEDVVDPVLVLAVLHIEARGEHAHLVNAPDQLLLFGGGGWVCVVCESTVGRACVRAAGRAADQALGVGRVQSMYNTKVGSTRYI